MNMKLTILAALLLTSSAQAVNVVSTLAQPDASFSVQLDARPELFNRTTQGYWPDAFGIWTSAVDRRPFIAAAKRLTNPARSVDGTLILHSNSLTTTGKVEVARLARDGDSLGGWGDVIGGLEVSLSPLNVLTFNVDRPVGDFFYTLIWTSCRDVFGCTDSGLTNYQTGSTVPIRPIPEPGTWALMLAGLGLLMRRFK